MPAELAVLLLLGHCVHLERDVLEPRLEALALPRHLADLVLDRLVLDEELTEGAPGSRERDGLLDAGPGHPRSLRGEEPPLVVEVVHDLLEPVADPADDVLLGHLDVVELDVGGATGPHAHAVHLAGGDPRGGVPLDEQHGEALVRRARRAGSHGDCEVVGVDAVGDPLLVAVDEEVVALVLGGAREVGDVGTRAGFGDAETDYLLAREALAHDAILQSSIAGDAKVEDGRHADAQAAHHGPRDATARAGALVDVDELVEVIVPLRLGGARVLTRPRLAHARGQDAVLGGLGVHALDVLAARGVVVHGRLFIPVVDD